MMKYRKKPVVVEAFQMTRQRRDDNSDWPCWLHMAWQKGPSGQGAVFASMYPNSNGKDKLAIQTLEGMMIVEWGDWIIKGSQGELYPCKPDVFAEVYEAVEV